MYSFTLAALVIISTLSLNNSTSIMTSFPIGSSVVLKNLVSGGQYNGQEGIVRSDLTTAGRQEVSVVATEKTLSVKPANLRRTNSKRAASSEKNDGDASIYPLFNPKSKKMKDAVSKVVDESAVMRKNGTLHGGDRKWSCAECKSAFEFNFSSTTNNTKKSGPFACVECNDKFCGKCESSEFSCDFCPKGLCKKCRDYDEKMLRCDMCGVTSCNSLMEGNRSCPALIPDKYYDELPLCQGECRM